MSTAIRIKRSEVANAKPSANDLVVGEIAANITDKVIYVKNSAGTVVELVRDAAAAGGVQIVDYGYISNTVTSQQDFGSL